MLKGLTNIHCMEVVMSQRIHEALKQLRKLRADSVSNGDTELLIEIEKSMAVLNALLPLVS